MLLRLTLICVSALLIVGCSTTTSGPLSIGDNRFLVSREKGFLPSGSEPLLEEAIAEASRFCEGLDGNLVVVETRENPGPYIFGNYPKATIVFECQGKKER